MGSFLLLLGAVGWAKAQSAVPTIGPQTALRTVGTLRFAHSTIPNLFRRLALACRQHRLKALAHDRFRLADDARDELGAARDVMDEPLHLPGRPDAFISIAGRIDHLAAGSRDELADVLEPGAFLLHRDHLGRDRIPGNPRGVAHGAEDQLGLALVIGDDTFLDELVDRALAGSHEARAHVDALGAERQRRDEAAAVAEAARGDQRDLHLVGGGRDQDQAGRVVLAGMTGAFKAVDRDGIDAHAFGRERVADAGAFVHDLDAVLLELGDMLLRLVARCLDDLDAAFD